MPPSTLRAEYPALSRAATHQWQARNQLAQIRRRRAESTLDPASLGRILPARDLLEAFALADRETGESLQALGRRCGDVACGTRDVRHLLRSTDESVAEVFEALADRVGAVAAVGVAS